MVLLLFKLLWFVGHTEAIGIFEANERGKQKKKEWKKISWKITFVRESEKSPLPSSISEHSNAAGRTHRRKKRRQKKNKKWTHKPYEIIHGSVKSFVCLFRTCCSLLLLLLCRKEFSLLCNLKVYGRANAFSSKSLIPPHISTQSHIINNNKEIKIPFQILSAYPGCLLHHLLRIVDKIFLKSGKTKGELNRTKKKA